MPMVLMSSENVRLGSHRTIWLLCPGRDGGAPHRRAVGQGAYLLAVSLWMPNSRAIARRDRPLSLASWTDFHMVL